MCGGYNDHINVPDCKPYFRVFACFFSSDYAGAVGDVLAQFLGSRGLSWYPQVPPTRPRSPWRYVVVCLLATWELVCVFRTIPLLGLNPVLFLFDLNLDLGPCPWGPLKPGG